MKKILLLLMIACHISACKQQASQTIAAPSKTDSVAFIFNADSAYMYTKTQVDFGARVPNTKAHQLCAAYLSGKLTQFGVSVIEQKCDLKAFDGTLLHSVNIIGTINPSAEKRILLYSHWESRPWADNDPDPSKRKMPVMAANDGASGVGVLLEVARQLSLKKADIGVDIIFFDAEDYGAPDNVGLKNSEDTWCLGTQYWAKNPHVLGYKPMYAILLDMVGAPDATFYREQVSEHYAPEVLNKVWAKAIELGYGKYFFQQAGGAITDDHVYVNQIAGIPSIDIIDFKPGSGFGTYWHTTHDTMDNVDPNTLSAVGTTLLSLIYSEK